jgi:hypothetical protein
MDHFGIGHAVAACLGMYRQAARRTGRTTSLVESLKTGDRVVCLPGGEADRIRRLAKERDIHVSVVVVPVGQPHRLFESEPSEGRTIFDHAWVEEFYFMSIKHTIEELDRLAQQASGDKEGRRQTERARQEQIKWLGL